MVTVGCSILDELNYRPDINQGNYFTLNDASKIRIGMTQKHVIDILGTPILSNPFSADTWIYVFRQQIGHNNVTQRTMTLTFNSKGILTNVEQGYITNRIDN